MIAVRSGPVLAGAGVFAALIVSADREAGTVICPFRRCTGGYCPGCGGTRATRSLFTGDLGAAWTTHPWVVLMAAQILILGAGFVMLPAASRRVVADRILVPIVTVNCVGALALWVFRLQTESIPAGWF